jgi:hypothetical protein
MNVTLQNCIAAVAAAGALALGTFTAHAQKTDHLAEGLLLSSQIASKAAQGTFTDGAGVLLNRYGGVWKGTTNAAQSFYRLQTASLPPANLTTCAPLISRLLAAKCNFKWSSYSFNDPVTGKTNVSTASPAPYQMLAMMKQAKGFSSSTTRLDLALAGDILVFSRIGNPADDHAALFIGARWDTAVEYPADLPDSIPALAGLFYVEVEILDSTGTALHAEDSRLVEYPAGVFTVTHGVGTGVMGILVNAAGEIQGHTWSLPTNGDPLSTDDDERNDWVRNLNGRIEAQAGTGGRELRLGRVAL